MNIPRRYAFALECLEVILFLLACFIIAMILFSFAGCEGAGLSIHSPRYGDLTYTLPALEK